MAIGRERPRLTPNPLASCRKGTMYINFACQDGEYTAEIDTEFNTQPRVIIHKRIGMYGVRRQEIATTDLTKLLTVFMEQMARNSAENAAKYPQGWGNRPHSYGKDATQSILEGPKPMATGYHDVLHPSVFQATTG